MVWNLIFSLLLNVGEIKTLNCRIWKASSSNQKENNLWMLIEFWVPIILCFCDFVGLLYFSDLRQREKGRNLTRHSICESLRHPLCVILFFSNLIAFWWGVCAIWSKIYILCGEKIKLNILSAEKIWFAPLAKFMTPSLCKFILPKFWYAFRLELSVAQAVINSPIPSAFCLFRESTIAVMCS